MNTVKVKAYAKINLSLNILGENNGFHNLDTVVSSIDLFDEIILRARKDKLVNVYMKGLGFETLPMDKNNAYKVANRFVEKFNTCGADITIYKNIPQSGGLGGSSADSAGVLNGLKKMYEIDDKSGVEDIAKEFGSDTLYMLYGGFKRLRGRGNDIEDIECNLKLNILLLIPTSGVNTSKCFLKYDELLTCDYKKILTDDNAADNIARGLKEQDLNLVGKNMFNSLMLPAFKINPQVEIAYNELKKFAPLGVVMSGAGSSVYALFENEEFVKWAKSRYRGRFKIFNLKTYNNFNKLDDNNLDDNNAEGLKNPFTL